MMEIKHLKTQERLKFKSLRKKITKEEINLVKSNVDLYLNSIDKNKSKDKHIAIYWPLKNEIDLRYLKEDYPLALPRSQSNKIINYYSWDDTPLKKDINGIPAPNNKLLLNHKEIYLIFIPCISIDREFNRLGYGGGFFDKLRSNHKWYKIPSIGILTSKCVSEELLSRAEWDIPLSGFITDKEILI